MADRAERDVPDEPQPRCRHASSSGEFLVAALLQPNVTEGESALAAGRLLSATGVARRLGVCSATVYALCAKGA
jgi:hypothetical protein